MDQRKRLAICDGCINRKLDYELGYVCRLTGRFADFEGTCKHFVRDHTVVDTIKVRTEDRPFVPLFDPSPAQEELQNKRKASHRKPAARKPAARKPQPRKPVPRKPEPRKPAARKPQPGKSAPGQAISEKQEGQKTERQKPARKEPSIVVMMKLRKYQSFLYALIGGLLVAAGAAIGWALASAMTGYQGVYFALGVGLLLGIAIRFFGAGIKKAFGILAALLALTGSVLGYYLSQKGFLEEAQLAGIMNIPGYLNTEMIFSALRDSFVPLDLLFYGLAALLAYLIAIRRISSKKMSRLESEGYSGAPALYWLRLPLILVLVLLPTYYGFTLTKDNVVKLQKLYYDSGKLMSEGELRNGVEEGQWTSWHENGKIKSTGFYLDGRKDSLWTWYDESGVRSGTGSYDNDMEEGTWVHYYPDGVVSDSGSYHKGLQEGLWEYFHENGRLKSQVQFKAGKLHGEKILVSPSGTLVNVDYYENGVLLDKGR